MHIPVLQKEILQYLDPKPNENFVDCTLGQGGHSRLILEKTAPSGKVLGIDLDEKQIKLISEALQSEINFKDRLIIVNANYANLPEIVKENNFINISGILLDAGFSSFQTDISQKGFSFMRNETLDMRYSDENQLTAKKIVNEWNQQEIEKILKELGEEKFSRQIAKKIVEERRARNIETTFDLVNIIEKAIPAFAKAISDKHIATRTFQALRIAANNELSNLENFIPKAISILSPGGKLAIISFHSLEDRIVKNSFKNLKDKNLLKILTKKPIEAAEDELKINPRARSAKLRVAEKI